MRAAYLLRAGAIALMALAPIACNDADDNVNTVTPTSVPPGGSGNTTTSTMTQIRFAHMSPNKPPIDICVASHGSGLFAGPILKLAGVDANGLAYNQVSRYFTYTAGSYDIRVVDGGATTCAQSLFDATALPAFVAGASSTVVATGLIPPNAVDPNAFVMPVYADAQTTPAGSSLVRFVHVSPTTPALDFGSGSGTSFTANFANVSYLNFGNGPAAIDNGGYFAVTAASAPTTFTVRVTGSSSDSVTISTPWAQVAGATLTFYAVGSLTPQPKPLQILLCNDNGTNGGPLSPCVAAP